MAYIYQIINTLNQKRYIGETLNFNQRISNHWSDLNNQKHHSQKLQRAFNKYGANSFKAEIIAEVPDDDRFDWECYYIKKYNTYIEGYNETSGGDNPGYEKLQKIVYCYDFEGNYLDEWYCSGREAARILNIDQALLQKICIGTKKSAYDNNGRRLRFSYELVDKLDLIQTKENQKKKVYQYDKNYNLIHIHESRSDAAESLGLGRNTRGGIIRAINSGKLYHDSYWKEN